MSWLGGSGMEIWDKLFANLFPFPSKGIAHRQFFVIGGNENSWNVYNILYKRVKGLSDCWFYLIYFHIAIVLGTIEELLGGCW